MFTQPPFGKNVLNPKGSVRHETMSQVISCGTHKLLVTLCTLRQVWNNWTVDGTPVVMTTPELFYPSLDPKNETGDLTERLRSATVGEQGLTAPSFVVCYGRL